VVQAHDGQDALAHFEQEQFDLVVLDVMLPRMDGLEVCRRMRAQSVVPIIMLTAKSQEADKAQGHSVGACTYLIKPFSPLELRRKVQEVLHARTCDVIPNGDGRR
jgi:DNA-binding response OmpR family regulator